MLYIRCATQAEGGEEDMLHTLQMAARVRPIVDGWIPFHHRERNTATLYSGDIIRCVPFKKTNQVLQNIPTYYLVCFIARTDERSANGNGYLSKPSYTASQMSDRPRGLVVDVEYYECWRRGFDGVIFLQLY